MSRIPQSDETIIVNGKVVDLDDNDAVQDSAEQSDDLRELDFDNPRYERDSIDTESALQYDPLTKSRR